MANLERLQLELKNQIEKAYINFKKAPTSRLTQCYIESRLENLDLQWNNFVDNHNKIICEIATDIYEKSDYCLQDVYGVTEECYFDYKSELREELMKLESIQVSSRQVSEPSQCQVKLPKISIPTFSGKYSEWCSFRDLFTSLIHNNKSLDDVQRLHYLKAHLTGEAEQLLRHVPITSNNYVRCWNQLEGRYNNKKHLTNSILNRLIGQKVLTFESSNAIKELLDTTSECLNGLMSLGVDVSSWDIILIYIISLKLDTDSRKHWECKIGGLTDALPTLRQFMDFLEHRFRSLEFLDTKTPKQNCHNVSNLKSLHVTTKNCPYCSKGHRLCNCKKFANEHVDSRRKFVQTNRLCYNCLGTNHSVYFCRQKTNCHICKKKHHSLLHPIKAQNAVGFSKVQNQPTANVVNVATTSQNESINTVSCFATSHSQVLLATALVRVQSQEAGEFTFRSLLDQGSQASFITEAAVHSLNLQKMPHRSLVSGLGSDEGSAMSSRWVVNLRIQSLQDPNFILDINAHVLNKITGFLPRKGIDLKFLDELPKFKLADPTFSQPKSIDILLGADVYGKILLDGFFRGPVGCPVAQNTRLGWVLSGCVASDANLDNSCHAVAIVNLHAAYNDSDLLKRFSKLESEPTLDCTKQLRDSTIQNHTDGSRGIAARRFHLLEQRFLKNPYLQIRYESLLASFKHFVIRLVQFHQRHKWRSKIDEPKIGDFGLVKKDNFPPVKWLYILLYKASISDR